MGTGVLSLDLCETGSNRGCGDHAASVPRRGARPSVHFCGPPIRIPARHPTAERWCRPSSWGSTCRYRKGSNLTPHLRRIIKRAGLIPWPRTWHTLRASRRTELASNFPFHTVCSWIGNTKAIAVDHYLQVTDADWQRAVGGADSGAAPGRDGSHRTAKICARCWKHRFYAPGRD